MMFQSVKYEGNSLTVMEKRCRLRLSLYYIIELKDKEYGA